MREGRARCRRREEARQVIGSSHGLEHLLPCKIFNEKGTRTTSKEGGMLLETGRIDERLTEPTEPP